MSKLVRSIPPALAVWPVAMLASGISSAQESQTLFTGVRDVDVPAYAADVPVDPTFKIALPGDLNGNGVPDTVTLQGNQVVLTYDPEVLDLQSVMPQTATAIAVIPDPSGADRDVLLMSAFDGLRMMQHSQTAPYYPSTVIDARPVASYASALCTADLDGDGRLDLVGLNGAGTQVFALLNGTSGWVPVNGEGYTDARSICSLDFEGDGVDEVAVATAGGMRLLSYSPSASPQLEETDQKRDLPAKGPLAAISGSSGPAGDQLVWIAETGGPWEFVLSWGSDHYGAMAHIYDPRIVGLAAGDFDGMGGEDLVVSHRHAHKVAIFRNESHLATPANPLLAFPITQNFYEVVPLLGAASGTSADTNGVTPGVLDLDGDSDLDLYIPIQSTGKHKRAFNILVDESDQQVSSYIAWMKSAEGGLPTLYNKIDAQRAPSGATHMEVMAWRCATDGTGVGGYVLDPVPIHSEMIDIAVAAGPDDVFVFDFVVDYRDGGSFDPSVVYFYIMRYRNLDGAGHAYPARATAFVYEDNPTALAYLDTIGVIGEAAEVHDDYNGAGHAGSPGGQGSGEIVGCLPPVGCVPLPPDEPPPPTPTPPATVPD